MLDLFVAPFPAYPSDAGTGKNDPDTISFIRKIAAGLIAKPSILGGPQSYSNRPGRLLRECQNFTEVRDGSHRERNQLSVERIGLG